MEESKPKVFKQRLDFYGQALAAYLIVLIPFLVFHSTLDEGILSFNLFSPLVILMLVIIFITLILFITAIIKRKTIIIDDNSITFQNRFLSKKFNFDDIQRIKINKSPSNVVKNDARFVRIKIKNKAKILLVRTASFDKNKDKELLHCFIDIAKIVNGKVSKQV